MPVKYQHQSSTLTVLWNISSIMVLALESQYKGKNAPSLRHLVKSEWRRHEAHALTLLTWYIHTFNGLFPRTTWVSWHQKGKPFWILLKQEMMGWQWHQLDHMQIICTTLRTDNHASTPSLNFLRAGCSSLRPTNSVKALKEVQSTDGSTADLVVRRHLAHETPMLFICN